MVSTAEIDTVEPLDLLMLQAGLPALSGSLVTSISSSRILGGLVLEGFA
jgi:hypothetical protein